MAGIESVPESAIAAFERLHGVRITVHDPAGRLRGAIDAGRHVHRHRTCALIKSTGHLARCLAFDVERLHSELPAQPDGRVQVCHAGVVECVLPLLAGDRLLAVLFAGAWSPGRDLRLDASDAAHTRLPTGTRPLTLPRLGEERARLLLEALRQLRARLEQWLAAQPPPAATGRTPATDQARRGQIMRYVRSEHGRALSLAELARWLRLSPSRCAHVVRDTCGESFSTLVMRERLDTARDLLARTALPVSTVLHAAGFRNRSHFHAAFRRRFATTPGRFRAQPRWPPPGP